MMVKILVLWCYLCNGGLMIGVLCVGMMCVCDVCSDISWLC